MAHSKKQSPPQTMTMWASVITPQRAKIMQERDDTLIEEIEASIPQDVIGAQVGNVVGWLRDRREFELIERLEDAIRHYNEWVKELTADSAR